MPLPVEGPDCQWMPEGRETRIRPFALVFDIGDTLLRTEPLRRRALQFALDRTLPDTRLEAILKEFDEAAGSIEFPNLLFLLPANLFERQIGSTFHLTSVESRSAACRYRDRIRQLLEPRPDVISMLRMAKSKTVSTGILSNGTAVEMEDVGYLMGLLPEVDFFASSEELGHNKPAREAFAAAEREIALPRNKLVMVGNDIDSDIRGALECGWKAIWVDGQEMRAPHGVPCIPFGDIGAVPRIAESLVN